jgi:hypothetical protein
MSSRGMAKSLGRQCCLSCVSLSCQAIIAVVFFCLAFYAASLILQPLQLVGISQIPPGIAYYDYRQGRF